MPHFTFIQQISILNILNMLYNLHFFSSKCRLFHNSTLFGFCITQILNTGCAKILKKIRRQKVKLFDVLGAPGTPDECSRQKKVSYKRSLLNSSAYLSQKTMCR